MLTAWHYLYSALFKDSDSWPMDNPIGNRYYTFWTKKGFGQFIDQMFKLFIHINYASIHWLSISSKYCRILSFALSLLLLDIGS